MMNCSTCGQPVHASTTHYGANGEILYYHDRLIDTWECPASRVIPLAETDYPRCTRHPDGCDNYPAPDHLRVIR